MYVYLEIYKFLQTFLLTVKIDLNLFLKVNPEKINLHKNLLTQDSIAS